MKRTILVLAAVIALASAGVYAKENKIVLEGSTTVLPIAQAAAESFMNQNPNIELSVRGGGSGVGITSFIEGTCDIANASRAMKDAELQKAVGRGRNPKANVIAMDGIAVIVSLSNSIGSLTKEQVKAIYTGKYSNWSKLGGPDEKLIVISRDSASGTYEAFGTLALAGLKVRRDALIQASNQAIASIVERTPGAIGYVGMGYVSDKVKLVDIGGVIPTKQTVLTGKYPYSRPLYMYTNGVPRGAAKQFIDFILSKDGQALVEKEGFVPLK
jgi:phosphate transport system substrate-binding protein